MLLTPDGKTVICGNISQGNDMTRCSQTVPPEIAEYSTGTGKLTRVVYQYHGTCYLGIVTIYWSDASGSAVIADIAVDLPPGGPGAAKPVVQHGLFSAGGRTELPLHDPSDLNSLFNLDILIVF
jgi:hypothetical protein